MGAYQDQMGAYHLVAIVGTNILVPLILAVFYQNFHGTRPNAHFEKIWTNNTHKSYIITNFFTRPKHDFTYPSGTGGWVIGQNTALSSHFNSFGDQAPGDDTYGYPVI